MAAGHEDDETVLVQRACGDLLRDGTAQDLDAGREEGRGGELRPIVDHRDVETDPQRPPGQRPDRRARRRQSPAADCGRTGSTNTSSAHPDALRLGDEPLGTAAFQAGPNRIAAGKGPCGGQGIVRSAIGLRLPPRAAVRIVVSRQPRRRSAKASAAWAKHARWRATVGSTSTRIRPPQIAPSSAASRLFISKSRRRGRCDWQASAAVRWTRASTAPPPTVPQRRPDCSMMALAPARCGVEPSGGQDERRGEPPPPSISSTILRKHT